MYVDNLLITERQKYKIVLKKKVVLYKYLLLKIRNQTMRRFFSHSVITFKNPNYENHPKENGPASFIGFGLNNHFL